MLHWEGETVEQLYRKVEATMPPKAAQTMSEQERLDIIAFVLKLNGFPAGSAELTLTPRSLTSLMLIGPDGPSAPRNGAIVSVIGCLAKNSAGQWLLSHASLPVLTSLEKKPVSEGPGAEAPPLGRQTTLLVSVYPDPAAHMGHKMEAKGLLIKDATGDRVNVMSLEMRAETCP
jgi:hypothetical protein